MRTTLFGLLLGLADAAKQKGREPYDDEWHTHYKRQFGGSQEGYPDSDAYMWRLVAYAGKPALGPTMIYIWPLKQVLELRSPWLLPW